MLLLQQMCVFLIIMFLGYFLAKKGKLDEHTTDNVSWIVVNVCNPCLILSGAFGEKISKDVVFLSLKVAVVVYIILLIVGLLMPFILGCRKNKVYSIMTVFGNIGFMGFPIIEAMYGKDALIFVTIFNIMFNVLMYTYGIMVISGSGFKMENIKKLFNIGIIACVIELILYFGNINLPYAAVNCISMISNLTAPLSMLVIGSTFVGMSVKSIIKDIRLISFSIIRLVVIPLALFPLLNMMVKDATLLGVSVIMLTVPVANMTVLIARQYKGDYEIASRGVALTTVLSVVTMPLIFMLLL